MVYYPTDENNNAYLDDQNFIIIDEVEGGQVVVYSISETIENPGYVDLITSDHRGKPKFEAMVGMVSDSFFGVTSSLYSLPAAFDLDYAAYKQLDAVGEWIGLKRGVKTPIDGVYFSLDIDGLGLDQGYLKGKYDPIEGITNLDDETYRMALRAKIGANHWDGTTTGLNKILGLIFPQGTVAFAQDNQDMSMSFYLYGALPAQVIISLFKGGYLSIKPAAVRVTGYYKPSVDNTAFFGLDSDGDYVKGLDEGALAVSL